MGGAGAEPAWLIGLQNHLLRIIGDGAAELRITWHSAHGPDGRWLPLYTRALAAQVEDDREICNGRSLETFRPVHGTRIKKERVPLAKCIGAVAVPVIHGAREHMEKLYPRVLETGAWFGARDQSNLVRLHKEIARKRMPQEFVAVPRSRADSLDLESCPSWNKRTIMSTELINK